MNDQIWTLERSLWLDGLDAWEKHLAENCIMAFGPTGALQNAQILDSLRAAPRWSAVELSDELLNHPAPNLAVLAYSAKAQRDGGETYRALCTSTYVDDAGQWKIAQHQQTPL